MGAARRSRTAPPADTLEARKQRLLETQSDEIAAIGLGIIFSLAGTDAFLDYFKQQGMLATFRKLFREKRFAEAVELIIKVFNGLLQPTTPAERAFARRVGRQVIAKAIAKLTGPAILLEISLALVGGAVALLFAWKKHEGELLELYESSDDSDKDAIFKANIGYIPGTAVRIPEPRYPLYRLGDTWYVKMGGKWYRVKDPKKEIEPGVTDVDKENVEAVTDPATIRELDGLRRTGGR